MVVVRPRWPWASIMRNEGVGGRDAAEEPESSGSGSWCWPGRRSRWVEGSRERRERALWDASAAPLPCCWWTVSSPSPSFSLSVSSAASSSSSSPSPLPSRTALFPLFVLQIPVNVHAISASLHARHGGRAVLLFSEHRFFTCRHAVQALNFRSCTGISSIHARRTLPGAGPARQGSRPCFPCPSSRSLSHSSAHSSQGPSAVLSSR